MCDLSKKTRVRRIGQYVQFELDRWVWGKTKFLELDYTQWSRLKSFVCSQGPKSEKINGIQFERDIFGTVVLKSEFDIIDEFTTEEVSRLKDWMKLEDVPRIRLSKELDIVEENDKMAVCRRVDGCISFLITFSRRRWNDCLEFFFDSSRGYTLDIKGGTLIHGEFGEIRLVVDKGSFMVFLHPTELEKLRLFHHPKQSNKRPRTEITVTFGPDAVAARVGSTEMTVEEFKNFAKNVMEVNKII